MFQFNAALDSVNNGTKTVHLVENFDSFVNLVSKIYTIFTKKQIPKKEVLRRCENWKGKTVFGCSPNDLTDVLEEKFSVVNVYIFSNTNGELFSTDSDSDTKKHPRIFMTLDESIRFLGRITIFKGVSDYFTVTTETKKAIADLKKIEENKRSEAKRTNRKLNKQKKSAILDEPAGENSQPELIRPFSSLEVTHAMPIEVEEVKQINFTGRSLRSRRNQDEEIMVQAQLEGHQKNDMLENDPELNSCLKVSDKKDSKDVPVTKRPKKRKRQYNTSNDNNEGYDDDFPETENDEMIVASDISWTYCPRTGHIFFPS